MVSPDSLAPPSDARLRRRRRGPGRIELRDSSGFTLIELMVVVVIVGVIATLATIGVRKYVYAAKSTEAASMIQQIKGAEENWLDETFRYLSASSTLEAVYPQGSTASLGKTKYQWQAPSHPDFANWMRLGVTSSNPSQMGYAVVAGGAGVAVPSPAGLPDPVISWPAPSGPWYVVRASADQDGDATLSYFVASSFTAEIRVDQEDE